MSARRSPHEAPAGHLLRFLLDAGRPQIARAVATITRLAVQSPPVVFHCHTGKDRTGLIAIVVLSLTRRSPEEHIVADYLASNPGFEAMRAALTADAPSEFMAEAPPTFGARSPGMAPKRRSVSWRRRAAPRPTSHRPGSPQPRWTTPRPCSRRSGSGCLHRGSQPEDR